MSSDSGEASQISSGESGENTEPSPAMILLNTRDWLKCQIHDYKSDAISGTDSTADKSDVLELSRRVKSLQNDLFFKTLDLDKKEQLVRRIQLGHTLEGYLFPQEEEEEDVPPEMRERREHMERLVNKQAELVSKILKIHEEMTEARPGLEALKKKNFELKKDSRVVLEAINEQKEKMKDSAKKLADDRNTKQNYGYLKTVMEKITVKRQVLQALVLGSGIDWFTDPEQQKLVLELGETLDF